MLKQTSTEINDSPQKSEQSTHSTDEGLEAQPAVPSDSKEKNKKKNKKKKNKGLSDFMDDDQEATAFKAESEPEKPQE